MSAPRLIVPGITYLLTRRCFGRRFLLRPSAKVNQIFRFCLAVAAARTGVLIHAYCVLSNHYHIVATDPDGNLPVFMHWLNEYVAKCVNTELGRTESFWAPGSYNSVTLCDNDAILGRLVYTFTNPVSAGLVQSCEEWPGARSLPNDMMGPAQRIDRPKGFFRNGGPVAESEVLHLTLPPSFQEEPSRWLQAVKKLTANRESEIRDELARRKIRFLGRRKVLRQSPASRPASAEPKRTLNPRVAASDMWRRIEALRRLKDFLNAYREAWRAYVDRDHTAVFPFGTYNLRLRFAVRVGEPPEI